MCLLKVETPSTTLEPKYDGFSQSIDMLTADESPPPNGAYRTSERHLTNAMYCGEQFSFRHSAENHIDQHYDLQGGQSCSPLLSYKQSFPQSPTWPGMVHLCGFRGQKFPRSGPTSFFWGPRPVSEANWQKRTEHLLDLHRCRRCNPIKRFYKASHFHHGSGNNHSGIEGNWTAVEAAFRTGGGSPIARSEIRHRKLREMTFR